MSGPMDPERCEDCGRPVATPEDAKLYAGGEGEHLCWGGCEPPSPAEMRAEIERMKSELRAADLLCQRQLVAQARLRRERDDARGRAETLAVALAVEAGRPVGPYLAALDWTTPDVQASLEGIEEPT